MKSSINAKGQVTIPKAIRARLGLKARDRVKFFVRPNGGVVLLPMLPMSALRGIIAPRESPATIEEMTEAVAAGAIDSAGLG
jgi:antitoxin PrlF